MDEMREELKDMSKGRLLKGDEKRLFGFHGHEELFVFGLNGLFCLSRLCFC